MEKFTLFGETPLFYIDEGPKESDAVMLVHGYLESALMWDDFTSELKHDNRIIRLDLPGHGLSSMPEDQPLSMEYIADAMHFVLQESGISKCTLVGHDFGGDAIVAFAKKHPESASGLVFFHSLPTAYTEAQKQQKEKEMQLIQNDKMEQVAHQKATNYFAKNNRSRFIDTLDECAEMFMLNEKEPAIATINCMLNREDATEFLSECAIPTMLIFGREDPLISEEEANNLISKLPDSKVVWLDHSGHMGFIEEKKIALEAIQSFLR